MSDGGTTKTDALARITVVLHRTRSAENVGAVARVVGNFGVGRLLLADPAGFDLASARRVAAESAGLLDSAERAPALEEAVARFERVVVTTARRREKVAAVGPEEAARYAVGCAHAGNEVALVFGAERTGLPRWVVERAHLVSTVDTAPEAPSLNLAQAVLLHLWELHRAARGAEPAPPLAPVLPAEDLERLRERTRALLLSAGYLDRQNPDRILSELERLLLRAAPTERDGRLLLGLIAQLEWAVAAGRGD